MNFSKKFYSATQNYSTYFEEVPAPYIRKNLDLKQKPQRAEICVAGLGFYRIFVNGQEITKGLLAPYISNPDDFIYYDVYDLTTWLNPGRNTIAFLLGNGLLNNPGGLLWDFDDAEFRHAPMLAFSLDLDGNITEADESLKWAPSPICFDDLRTGEFYDARMEIDGWNLPDFDDSQWRQVIRVTNIPRGVPTLCMAEPIVIREEIAPVSIIPNKNISAHPVLRDSIPKIGFKEDEHFPEGGYLYDFGINTAGMLRLKLKNTRPGQKIVMQFGEVLGEDGGIDLLHHDFQPQRFNYRNTYTCKGAQEEVYFPSFNYQGFRYCIAFGLTAEQAVEDTLTYCICASDLKINAGFRCSDDISNKIWDAGINSNLTNFYYFPTDCPHREKNGWTGDAALSAEQMMVTLTPLNSYREWLRNIRATQSPIGEFPGIVPTYKWGYGTGPAWDIVIVNLPYYAWLYTGNTEILKENAHAIVRYLDCLFTESMDDRYLRHGGLTDWCPAARPYNMGTAPKEFCFLCVYMDTARKAAKIFDVLGYRAQKNFALELYERSKALARKYFIDTNRMIAAGGLSQTAQAMAIYNGVFEEAEKPEAFRRLLGIIEKKHNTFDTGILGARVLFHVLSDFGRSDLAYGLIVNPELPSYGNWIRRNGTSFWEEFKVEGRDPSSHNHHMFGDVLSWYIKHICGIIINPHGDGVNDILIKPDVIPQLTFAEGYENIPAGRVSTRWEKQADGCVRLEIMIPQGVYGFMVAPEGWQFPDGMTHKPVESGTFLLLPDTVPDELSDFYRK